MILVPSPNVSEDHQTKNAMALVNKNAAIYIADAKAKDELFAKAIEAPRTKGKMGKRYESIIHSYKRIKMIHKHEKMFMHIHYLRNES